MDKKLKTKHKIITSARQWEKVSNYFSSINWVGLDTEFMRERTYYPQLCLVQLATQEVEICFDTLAFDCSSILAVILSDKSVTKILHSASQDIEVLGHYCGSTISNVYDTQLAAEFCNLPPQMGYAGLVKELLNLELPKSQTRSNWAKRPLTELQIEYSLNDVRYLKAMYDSLNEQLQQTQKSNWFKQEQVLELERMLKFRINPSDSFKSFKSSHRFAAQNQQVIKQLVIWREQTAQQTNKPKNWILTDKSISEIGKVLPQDKSFLRSLLTDDPRFKARYLDDILNKIEQGLKQPAEPVWKQQEQLSEPQKLYVKKLRKSLEQKAAEYQIPITRIATRKDIVNYVSGNKGKLTFGWRNQILNEIS